MPWLKYRYKASHGKGPWEYHDLGPGPVTRDDVLHALDELADKYNHSEHYRGLEHRRIAAPPREVVEEELNAARDQLTRVRARCVYLKALLDELAEKNLK
jgi:hypothetical protein